MVMIEMLINMTMMAMTMVHNKHPSIVKEVSGDHQNIAVVIMLMPTVSLMMMKMINLNVISSARVEISQRGSLVRCLDSSHLNNHILLMIVIILAWIL